MAATKRQSSPPKRRSPAASKNGARGGKSAVARGGKSAVARGGKSAGARAGKSAGGRGTKSKSGRNGAAAKARSAAESMKPSRPARFLAGKVLKTVVRRAVKTGATVVRTATERGTDAGRDAVESALSKRLPIQVSIDVAVPLSFAWDEWMTFEWMTEGVHRIVDVERDGSQLFGQLAGARSVEWEAEVVDERDEQSFAWRSVAGSDCAGLVTFHRLSARLTRIELDLDVLPTNPAEAASLALRIGRRRAESELRRFKAHVEFINPDVYESDGDEELEEPEEAEEPEPPEDEEEDQ
jgi:uncharacterized membrane protein